LLAELIRREEHAADVLDDVQIADVSVQKRAKSVAANVMAKPKKDKQDTRTVKTQFD
jgi:hypothetical protein